MSKYLIIGDLQIKHTDLVRGKAALEQLSNLSINADITVFLGDQYDGKAIIRSEVQNLYINAIREWPTPVFMLIGNHDYEGKHLSQHSLKPLALLPNVHIIEEPTDVDGAIFVSYMETDRFVDYISKRLIHKDTILFAHQGINGFQYSNGMVEDNGIDAKLLSGFKLCFLGHIHKPATSGNIIYVGSPYTQNFGESGEQKHVIMYNDKTQEIEEIMLDLPQHIRINRTLNNIDDLEDIKKVLKTVDGNMVQLVIEAPIELAQKLTKKMIKATNLYSLKVKVISPNKEVLISEALSPLKMVEKYLEIYPTQVNKSELVVLNAEIMDKCE